MASVTLKTENVEIKDEAHWLGLRDGVLTSTDASALFGLSPYTTRFEIYHHHANGITVPFKSNDRVEKGNRMEAYAAHEVGLSVGAEVRPMKHFAICRDERVGSSFDWEIMGEDGWEILEIKAVDYFRHKETWTEDEATEYVECQAQWQMMISGHKVCNIAAFTGVYDFSIIRRERDDDFCAALLSAARSFWRDVDVKREPEPDFARDDAVIALLHKNTTADPVNMDDDEEFKRVVARFDVENAQAKEFTKKAKATKAEIHHMLGDNAIAFTDDYKITAGWTKDTPGRAATEGEIVGARAGYRQCLIKELKRGAD